MLTGIKLRVLPPADLAFTLNQWIGAQMFIQNSKTREYAFFSAQRRIDQRSYPDTAPWGPVDQTYAQFKDKEQSPWLYAIPSQVLRNGAVRWMTAKQRHLSGLARPPVIRQRSNYSSVLLTRELFRFVPVIHKKTGEIRRVELEIGTEANPLGRILFKHPERVPATWPAMLTVRRTAAGKWQVSYSYDDAAPEPRSPEELAYEFNGLSDAALRAATTGLDRNIKDNCLMTSDGQRFDYRLVEHERFKRRAIGRQRHQRKLAGQVKGSKNAQKTQRKIARSHERDQATQTNFCHQTSHTLAESHYSVFAHEKLNIKGLTKKPAPKPDPERPGHFLPNRARAKAGLTKKILRSGWGGTLQFLGYKLKRRNKLLVPVAAAYSSQECSACGHTHPDNRHQQRFVCQRCKLELHADINAACVIKQRGLAKIRSGTMEVARKKKSVSPRGNKSTPRRDTPGMPVEQGSGTGRVIQLPAESLAQSASRRRKQEAPQRFAVEKPQPTACGG